MIEIHELTKEFVTEYGELLAVDSLSLSVAPGQIFGFLGPNGAGKTTTIRMLSCLLRPTSGSAFINGYQLGVDDQEIRSRIGLLTEIPGLFDTMSAAQNLAIYARLHCLDDPETRARRFLQMLGLWNRRNDRVGGFSKGMKQKLAIARAALHDPDVLFLDEPTSGLDPDIAKTVRDFILDLKNDGRTIILSTHNLDEAERMCDLIGVFKNRLIRADTPANLRRELFGREQVFVLRRIEAEWVHAIYALPFVTQINAAHGTLSVTLENPEEQNSMVVRALVELGAEIQYVTEIRQSLEDVSLKLINDNDV
jgi:ABC-2 type transport system ATP-binding protein